LLPGVAAARRRLFHRLLLTDYDVLDGHAVLHLGRFEASFRRHPVRIPGNVDEFIAQEITSINLFLENLLQQELL
jgi:hypothetical protein